MTKKQMVNRLIRAEVFNALATVYRMDVSYPSEKQEQLADMITEAIYNLTGNKFTHKELVELIGEENEDISDAV